MEPFRLKCFLERRFLFRVAATRSACAKTMNQAGTRSYCSIASHNTLAPCLPVASMKSVLLPLKTTPVGVPAPV